MLALQSLRTITSIIFVPFETRFGALIDRFALNQRMFEGELNLLDQRMLIKHFERFELKTQSDVRAQEEAREKENRMSERKKKEKEHKMRRKEARLKERQKERLSKHSSDLPSYEILHS